MFHSRTANKKINKLQERALRFVYNNYDKSFSELLNIDNSFTFHEYSIQVLATEIFKYVNGISCELLQNLFTDKTYYHDIRSKSQLMIPSVHTEMYGKNSLRYFGACLWKIIPTNIKNANSINEFKSKIKKWRPENCPCRLCMDYIPEIGYINLFE